MPPVIASDALTRPGQGRRAAQAQRQLGRVGQRQRADHLELVDVDVDAMEAREQHQPVGAGRVERLGEVREGREERRELDRDRNPQAALHLADDLDRLPFDLGGARAHVAGGVVEVQLEAVRAGLLEQLRVAEPAAVRRCR